MLQLAVGLLHLTQGGLFNSPSTLYAVLVANSLSFSLINVTWSYVSFYQAHSKALEIRTRIAVFYVQIRHRKINQHKCTYIQNRNRSIDSKKKYGYQGGKRPPRCRWGQRTTCQCRKCKRWAFVPGLGRSLEEEMTTTPVFWPGESRGQRRLAGHGPWGSQCRTRLERLSTHGGKGREG